MDACPRVLAPELGRHRRRLARPTGSRRAAPPPRRKLGLGAPSSNGAPRVLRVGAELAGELLELSSVSSAEWLLGWPSIGSDQPLIV